MTAQVEVISGDVGDDVVVVAHLYELGATAPTEGEALAALAGRCSDLFDRWAQRPGNRGEGCRPALRVTSRQIEPSRGRHAASIHAEMLVIGPRRPKPEPVDLETQARLSAPIRPSREHHRQTLRAALARAERGEAVLLDRVMPSLIAMVLDLDDEEGR